MLAFLMILGLVVLVVGYGVLAYNKFVSQKNKVEEAWSDIEVQMKRRYNLIPNLVETVKGYAGHEKDTFAAVVKARTAAVNNQGSPAEQVKTENMLTGALRSLFAVAEAYPDLKASRNFADLQQKLAEVEDHIQKARRFYNGNVRDLNTRVEQFPSNLIANWFGFIKAEFFELDDPAAAKVPKVKF